MFSFICLRKERKEENKSEPNRIPADWHWSWASPPRFLLYKSSFFCTYLFICFYKSSVVRRRRRPSVVRPSSVVRPASSVAVVLCIRSLFSKIVTVFQGGPKRGNPMMTTSTVTARRKGDLQYSVEGKPAIKQLVLMCGQQYKKYTLN